MDLFRSTDEILEKIQKVSYLVENYPGVFIDSCQLERLEAAWEDLEALIAEFHRRLPEK